MVSVVVPVYNEEEIFHLLHAAIVEAMEPTGEQWEVVYVNDGSKDSTLDLLLQCQAQDPHVVVVDLSRNFGHMGAIHAGLKTAQGDAIALMDGDLQDPPSVIPEMIKAWRNGAQVVTTCRRSRKESRKLLAFLFPLFHRLLDALSDYPIPLNSGVFGLVDRQALDAMLSLQEGNRYYPGLRAWVGYKNAIVYYDRADRVGGEGKLSFTSRIKYAFDAICSFSYKPLRISAASGVLCIAISILLGLSMVVSRAMESDISVYTPLITAMFFLAGLQMICMGALAEYIGRIYDEVRKRPLSIIRQVYRSQEKDAFRFEPQREEQLRAA
jgi:glycosyltransferase involved in cell wall biosynthesis